MDFIYQMAIYFKKNPGKKKQRIPSMPKLLEETSWGFFDGANQGHPPFCGDGAVLYITTKLHFEIRYTPGRGSNMKVEVTTIWDLLFLAISLNL